MYMAAELVEVLKACNEAIAYILGVGCGEADPFYAVDTDGSLLNSSGKVMPPSVGIDILSKQKDLLDPSRGMKAGSHRGLFC
ncbi:MAG: hypothetical protein MZV63_57750 [Marinilabiliales bacterium]|nr:hypothetical protein [Marinilabiliales bacterium]